MAKTLLVVDDSRTIQKVFEMTFRRTGFDTTAAVTGQQGVSLVKEIKPDVVIIDAGLPDGSGLEFCRQIKSDPANRSLPVIAMAGKDANVDQESIRQFGAVFFIQKPFESQAIIDMAERASNMESSELPQVLSAPDAFETVDGEILESMDDEDVLQPVDADILEPMDEGILEPVGDMLLEPLEEETFAAEDEDDGLRVDIGHHHESSSSLLSIPEAGEEFEPLPEGEIGFDAPMGQSPAIGEALPDIHLETMDMEEELPEIDMEPISEADFALEQDSSVDFGFDDDMTPPSEIAVDEEEPADIELEEIELDGMDNIEETGAHDVPAIQDAAAMDILEPVGAEDDLVDLEEIQPEEDEALVLPEVEDEAPDIISPAEDISPAYPSMDESPAAFVSEFKGDVALAVPPGEEALFGKAQALKQAPAAAAGVSISEAQVEEMVMAVLKRFTEEKLEAIAWEVVPELAEVVIRKELDRLTAERAG